MTFIGYADDIALLTNTPAQAEPLQQEAGGISLHVNANKTNYTSFDQKGAISTGNSKLLKFENWFTYLGRNILSTKSDVNIHFVKAWNVIDRLSSI